MNILLNNFRNLVTIVEHFYGFFFLADTPDLAKNMIVLSL